MSTHPKTSDSNAWLASVPLSVQLMSLVLLAVTLPLAIYLFVALPFNVETLVSSDSRKLELESEEAVLDLERFIQRRINEMRILSQADVFEGDDIRAIDQYLAEIHEADEEFDGLILTDASGTILTREGRVTLEMAECLLGHPEGISHLVDQCRVSKQGDVFVSNVLNTPELGSTLVLLTPVTDDTNQVVVKILLAAVSMARPKDIVDEMAHLFSDDTRSYILNSKQLAIFSSDSEVAFVKSIDDLNLQPEFAKQLSSSEKFGRARFSNRQGEEVVAAFGTLSALGKNEAIRWNLLTIAPVRSMAGPAYDTRNQLLAIGAVVSFVSLLLALVLVRQITRPLRDVTLAAKQFSKGEYDTRLSTGGHSREVHEISTAFNSMAVAIRSDNQKLTDSELRYRSLIDLLPVGVQRIDKHGRIVLANLSLAKMYETTLDKLLGCHFWDLAVDEKSRRGLENYFQTLIKEQPEPTTQFKRNLTHGGRRIDIRLDWDYERNDDGRVNSIIAAVTDITEQKQAIDRNAAIVESFGEMVCHMNAIEDVVEMHGEFEKILGHEQADVGTSLEQWVGLVHPDEQDLIYKEIEAARLERRLFDVEFRMRHADGHYIWVGSRAVMHCNDAGELESMIGVVRDITLRREQEEELRTLNATLEDRVLRRTRDLKIANEDLEAYAHSVAHDLRAPLRAMFGFSRALREDCGDQLDEAGVEYTEFIEAASHQMDELIRDLLEYSKIGRSETSITHVDLEEVVDSSLKQLDSVIRQSKAEISLERPIGSIIGHRSSLKQIVVNLISNALKFVPDGVPPKIRIFSESSPQAIRLWIEDNGIGIDPEFHARIFKVFERLHGVESFPGTGIGLAIVRRAIESMGGRFGVESDTNQGSRFWVELPRSQELLESINE